jgi:hypothetical protein
MMRSLKNLFNLAAVAVAAQLATGAALAKEKQPDPDTSTSAGFYETHFQELASTFTIIFVAPDFATADMHPETLDKYFPSSKRINLPADPKAAQQLIVDTLRNTKKILKENDADEDEKYNVVIVAHGDGDKREVYLAGKDKTGIDAADLLSMDLDAAQVKPKIFLMASCYLLADATPTDLDKLADVAKVHPQTTPIMAANLTYEHFTLGGTYFPTPFSGAFYAIDAEGRYAPYIGLWDVRHLVQHGTSDEWASSEDYTRILVDARSARDMAGCSPASKDKKCLVLQHNYEVLGAYGHAWRHLNNTWHELHDAATYVEPVELQAFRQAAAQDIETLRRIAPDLAPLDRMATYDQILGSADKGSPVIDETIKNVLKLTGDDSFQRHEYYNSDKIDHDVIFNSGAYVQYMIAQYHIDREVVLKNVAEYLNHVTGLPSKHQIEIWSAARIEMMATEKTNVAVGKSLLAFEERTIKALNNPAYSEKQRSDIIDKIIYSDLPDPKGIIHITDLYDAADELIGKQVEREERVRSMKPLEALP